MIASTPEEMTAHLNREIKKWGAVFKEHGIKAESRRLRCVPSMTVVRFDSSRPKSILAMILKHLRGVPKTHPGLPIVARG